MLQNNRKGASLFIIILIIATDLSVLFNVPALRQVLASFLLAFVPGALLLSIMRPDKLGLTEKFVLTVGLSISFDMFIGILINTLYPIFDIETPLSTIYLLISLSVVLLILAVISHFNGGSAFFADIANVRIDTSGKAFVLIPIIFLPLSILGMHLMNIIGNNSLLMVLLFLIPAYVILISVCHNQIPETTYPLIIFLTSISLVLLMGMRGCHIIGADAHREYYIFQQTILNGRWQILESTTLDSCLSISVLPTIYQLIINTNPEYFFKIFYPILFSISPLIVYIITKEYLGSFYAFLASVFFMSQGTFLNATANPRTTVAILFFALSIMIMLSCRLSELEKRLLLIIFIFSCIVSHYSTSYIFFGILLFAFIIIHIISRLLIYQEISWIKKIRFSKELKVTDSASTAESIKPLRPYLTPGVIIIFFVAIFIWYSQVTGAAFDSGVGFIANSMRSLQDFFILESRQDKVVIALGSGIGGLEVPRKISFIFNWLTIIFIAIGVLTTLSTYHQKFALPLANADDHFSLLTKRIDILFISLATICSAIMVASVALPFVSNGYGLDRAYLMMAIVLSSFFVLGGMRVSQYLNVHRKYLFVLLVLVPFFMCMTGSMHQVFSYPGSMTLNSEGPSFDIMYIHDQESISSKWLKKYKLLDVKIYSDYWGNTRLISQGGIRTLSSIFPEGFIEEKSPLRSAYIYLDHNNIADGKLFFNHLGWRHIDEYLAEFTKSGLIYRNGGSDIFLSK